MIQYFVKFQPDNHLIVIEMQMDAMAHQKIDFQLPFWRPGRYQEQQFAKNILHFDAFDAEKKALIWKKTTKNIWQVQNAESPRITVRYAYFAHELNAGSSFVNSTMQYLNPVNFCFFIKDKINEDIEMYIEKHAKIACGIKAIILGHNFIIKAQDFHHLADSPIIISDFLQCFSWKNNETQFNFWVRGKLEIDIEKMITDLKNIAQKQIELFKEFPEKDYHFMLIIPEGTYYHGVEHRNSTMMVLGENGILGQNSYFDLMGLASHELFHAWNIAKIRPIELSPYNYTTENYFETCFVSEGFTTFYGDKICFDAEVFDQKQYLYELESTYKRHFDENDFASQSLLASSFDLWVDGYEKGVPNKKASVYSKGAIAAQILDIIIRNKHNNQKSLDDVMLKLWQNHGKTQIGYSYADIITICESVYEDSLKEYFDFVIASNKPILDLTNIYLATIGLEIVKNPDDRISLATKPELENANDE